jgi:hypothetical protein
MKSFVLWILLAFAPTVAFAQSEIQYPGANGLSNPVLPSQGGSGVAALPLVQTKCQSDVTNGAVTANEVTIVSLLLPTAFTMTSGGGMTYDIGTADASHPTDIGIYYCSAPGATGVLVEDIGAQDISGTGARFSAWMTNASCTGSLAPGGLCTGNLTGTYPTLAAYPNASANGLPGYYMWAITSTASTITYASCNGVTDIGWFAAATSGTSASGVLPATFTCPSQAINTSRGAFVGLN